MMKAKRDNEGVAHCYLYEYENISQIWLQTGTPLSGLLFQHYLSGACLAMKWMQTLYSSLERHVDPSVPSGIQKGSKHTLHECDD